MKVVRARSGYVFLISVLVIGAIAAATTISLLLLAGAAQRSAAATQQAVQASENARSCAERTIRALRANLAEAGESIISLQQGSCSIQAIGGSGNGPRTVCVQGRSGDAVRRLEVQVEKLFPAVIISQWREVTAFSLCP